MPVSLGVDIAQRSRWGRRERGQPAWLALGENLQAQRAVFEAWLCWPL